MSQLPILLGDSILRRLLLKHSKLYDPASKLFCVSGQRTSDLIELVRSHRQLLSGRKVFVLIGTNDVTKGTSLSNFKLAYRSLVRYLRRLRCQIVLCELLPIPRYLEVGQVVELINSINQFVRSFEPSGVQVIHTFEVFCNNGNAILSLYCQSMGKGVNRRVDLIHPNSSGLDVLLTLLEG